MCLRLWEETVIETESANKWQSHCTITPTGSMTEHTRSLTSRRLMMAVTLCGRIHLCELCHYVGVGAVFSFISLLFFLFFLFGSINTLYVFFREELLHTCLGVCVRC